MIGNSCFFLFSIEDTGIGIPVEKHINLFKKFSQADTSTSRKYGGTGLGLAISRELTELMKGTLTFVSEPGVKTIFTVRIPLRWAEKDIPEDVLHAGDILKAGEQGRFAQYRVLVVDDHPVNMLFARKLLKKIGFAHIDEAGTGIDALGRMEISNYSYNIIFMDCQMPEMDGFETTKRLREIEKEKQLPRTPIIAMTAHAMEGDRARCIQAGMDDYLSKPINPDKLMSVLGEWLIKTGISGHEEIIINTEIFSGQSNENSAVDITHLELFTEGDMEQEKMLANIFLTVGEATLAVLRQHIGGEKSEVDWKMATHKLKGSSAQIGAQVLAAACLKAESGYSSPQEEKMLLLANIEVGFENVRAFFMDRQA
jgi:CheY-like chemotaxis protein